MRSRIEITSGSDAKDDQLNKNILTLSQILENSPALSANDKIAAAEHLDQILDERQKPENSRRKGIILSSIDYLTKLLGAIPDLAQGWTLTEQAIRDTFGV